MVQIPCAEKGRICPLHKRDMSVVCHKCPLWIHIRGKNPQSEEQIDTWNCSLAFLPALLLENAQQSRQTGAAVESLRNVVAKTGDLVMAAVQGSMVTRPLNGPERIVEIGPFKTE